MHLKDNPWFGPVVILLAGIALVSLSLYRSEKKIDRSVDTIFKSAETLCEEGDRVELRIKYRKAIINYQETYERLGSHERRQRLTPYQVAIRSSEDCRAARAVISIKLPKRISSASPSY